FGAKTGIVSGDLQFTYAEFGDRATRLASALLKAGLRKGDRVAYLSFNNHQLLEGYYGVVIAQGVVMPLNVRLSTVEFINILNHSGARFLFYETEFVELVDKLRTECPVIEHFIPLDAAYESFLNTGVAERPDAFQFNENSVAELFYTSGSTGTPKGVMLTHRTLYLHALSVAGLYTDIETMVDLHTIPLFHANGWGHPQSSTMLGVKQVMVRRFEPGSVLKMIDEHRATDMCLVPTMANALLNSPELAKYNHSSLRCVMLGGAASTPELVTRVQAALGCTCIAGYGLTETGPVITNGRLKSTLLDQPESEKIRRQAMAGWALPNVEIRVVDNDLKDVPRDSESVGEVVVQGDHVMEGYFRNEAGTEAVMAGGWFHTGDMAVWDEERYIHIVDRKKEIIISGGENISSLEVEKAIFAHSDVYECAVVAAPDDKWGEVPAAIVVLKAGCKLTEGELIAFLQERLGKFKMPRIIEFTEEPLPKTGTGKIRKMVLKERFWEGKAKRVQG
ncbi:MAG: long-chain-fatty-acid--CoA ligase, partial [Bryobacteraceae bacterium]